jgi:Rps23 Pro-64 3,4-dihydroxylase Tpa1-like proline 4-hydroxylase
MISDNSKEIMLDGYKNNKPFCFSVIDNFLSEDKINGILNDVKNLEISKADYKFCDASWECNKYAFQKNFSENLQQVFEYFVSDEFIDHLEKLTGITGIIRNDLKLKGAGVHRILKDGFLQVHTDFNSYTSDKHGRLDRRINLLLYLNPDWKDEYNGHLLLCDRFTQKINYKISPLLNRCVIFNTTKNSLHGHPEKLNVPDNISRESIAVYYYTKNVNNIDFEGDPERPTLIFNVNHFDVSNIVSI